ncbi:MAG: SGNH/GDSL hydrolase family protein [Patescibacteria group bacterium]
MNSRKKKILQGLILFFITGVLGFIFLEFLIFKVAPQKTIYYDKINTAPNEKLYRYGVEKPVEIRPNLRLENITDLYKEYTMSITTDQFGFRREKTAPEKPSVVIIGDSMTFGFTVSNEEAYPSILEAEDASCQIINAGKPGAGLNHYAYYLKQMFKKNDLKNIRQVIVALNMPGNDWYEMPSLNPKIDPELTQFLRNSPRALAPQKSVRQKIKRLLSYSQTYTFLRQVVAPRIKHSVLRRINTAPAEEKEYGEIGPHVERLLSTIISLAKEKNIPIAFVFLPERPHYFPKPPLYVKNLQKFMEKKGVPFVDLLPPMEKAYTKTSDFWHPIEGHYNESGHAFIAKEIQKSGIIHCEK